MRNYYIINTGCDDETYGLVRLPDSLPTSKIVHLETNLAIIREIIENLNKNSTYSCKPTISIYQIPDSMIRPATDEDSKDLVMHTHNGDYVLSQFIGDWCYEHGADGRCFREFKLRKGVIQIV